MKKIVALCLCTVILAGIFSNFGITFKFLNPRERETLKILIIGNSHSVDAFHLLYDVFQDQKSQQKLVLGYLYYSGCSITKHVDFAMKNEPVYRFSKNSKGRWVHKEDTTMEMGLRDEPWDIVFLQAAKTDLDDTLNRSGRRELESIIDRNVPKPYDLAWHTSWPSPNQKEFFQADWVKQAPEGYKENLQRLYGFNPVTQFTVLTDMAKKHILDDDTYTYKVCTGGSIMYAWRSLGVSQMEIWRDYTHLSDYGRLIAAYSLYAQLTGERIDSIRMDTLPVKMRHRQYKELGELVITDDMKNVIIQSAHYGLENPWIVPE